MPETFSISTDRLRRVALALQDGTPAWVRAFGPGITKGRVLAAITCLEGNNRRSVLATRMPDGGTQFYLPIPRDSGLLDISGE